MLRVFLIAVVSVLFLGGTAAASDLSRVRCEDQPMTDLIKGELPKMKAEDGTSFAKYLGNNANLTATTVSAAADRVVCRINVNVAFGGDTRKIRGQFIYREFANGTASVTFIPFN
jgi:hypothetical protein